MVFILILLLLAAIAGVLGAVLKAALILALATVLAIAFIGTAAYYYARHRWRRFQRETLADGRSRVVITVPNEAETSDRRRLPDDGGSNPL